MNSWYRRFLFEGKNNYHIYLGEGFVGPVGQHKHEFYHVTYAIEGEILEGQYGTETLQKAGECFFTPPGVEHSLHIYEHTRYFCLSFSQNIADILYSHISGLRRDLKNLPSPIVVPEDVRSRLDHLLYSLIDEQNFDGPASYETAHFLVVSALLMMLRGAFPAEKVPSMRESDRIKAEVLACVRHIQANYDQELTAETLSQITTLSRSAFMKAFQLQTGKTVKQYVTQIRIKEARHRIVMGKGNLQQIAKQVGYKDFSTFFRNFVQIVGVSPTEYRKRVAAGLDSSDGSDE